MDTHTLTGMLNQPYFGSTSPQTARRVMEVNLLVLGIHHTTAWRQANSDEAPIATITEIAQLPKGRAQSQAISTALDVMANATPYGYLFQNLIAVYMEYDFEAEISQNILADSLTMVAALEPEMPPLVHLQGWLTTYTEYLIAHGDQKALLIPPHVQARLRELFLPFAPDIKNMYIHGVDNIDVPFMFGNTATTFYLAHQADVVLELFASLSQFLQQMPLSQMLPITDVDFEAADAQLPIFDALLVRLLQMPILEADEDQADKATMMKLAQNYFNVEAVMLTMIAANVQAAQRIVIMAQVNPDRDYLWRRFWQNLMALPDITATYEKLPVGMVAGQLVEYRLATVEAQNWPI